MTDNEVTSRGGHMNVCKLMIAFSLFVSSVSFEQQVLSTKSGMDVSWNATISVSQSFAVAAALEAAY